MQSLISVGDEVRQFEGKLVIVTAVEQGQYGLLVHGLFPEYSEYFGNYCPYELPPQEHALNWYNWGGREFLTLPSGYKLGCLGWWGGRMSLEEAEAMWEQTIELIRKEEQDDGDRVD